MVSVKETAVKAAVTIEVAIKGTIKVAIEVAKMDLLCSNKVAYKQIIRTN